MGIGTTTPGATVDVEDEQVRARLTSTDVNPFVASQLQFRKNAEPAGFFSNLGSIEFFNLDDEMEMLIESSLGRNSSSMSFSVGVGNTSPQLSISSEDGVKFGEHQIKPPLAYGTVASSGEIIAASSNVLSVTRVDTGLYWIEVADGLENTDVALVTLKFGTGAVIALTTIGTTPPILAVLTADLSGAVANASFDFVIYRP